MKATGSLALATVARSVPLFGRQQIKVHPPRVAIFFEESFPAADGMSLGREAFTEAFAGWETAYLGAADLGSKLDPSAIDLFLLPYGSAFPKEGWSAIVAYLRGGGNWLNLGGVPFSVPVEKEGTGWRSEVAQTEYHKRLGITQAFPVDAAPISSYAVTDEHLPKEILTRFSAGTIYELYVRFTETVDIPSESGSAGARDAVLHPLVHGLGADRRPVAAPFLLIDRMQGEYAGGRWVLANFKGRIEPKAIRALAELSVQGAVELSARMSYACYREGERPSLTLSCRRPKGGLDRLLAGSCRIELADERGSRIESVKGEMRGGGTLMMRESALGRGDLSPGLYVVTVRQELRSLSSGANYLVTAKTGFWIFDRRLLEGGAPFSTTGDYLAREGKPYVVTGTTYMGSDVHRKFLFEPNPYEWDRDFAQMKSAGINMVRTGIWTGWRNYMLDVGAPQEAALRALDAFLLTARRHDLPVIFTFFAFLPESWGGLNAYLDPRSVNAQKEFVMAFSQRYGAVNDLLWDVINEPSFCNPQYLWSCRPNYDKFESEAWQNWLKERYPAPTEEEWKARLQEYYRSAADEALALPALEEFNDVNIFGDSRPVKVIDYRLFAEEMFARWLGQMRSAIRANGNPHQLVTVGQDEGGTGESPNQHFFGRGIDFSCVHNWWLNDDLVWDNVMMKVPGMPNLVEETGIMFYEKSDGSPWRSEEEARDLLERKLAIAIGAGGAGFIEWIWNINPFMKSDNEAAIGIFRADGTAKPELDPLAAMAKFFASQSRYMRGGAENDVFMVIPHSQMYSTRNFATEATRRCVRAMTYHCRMPLSSLSEYGLPSLTIRPKLLLLPSPRTLAESAWQAISSLAAQGSTVLISGAVDADDHWMPRDRLSPFGIASDTRPVASEESLTIGGKEFRLSFRGDKLQRIEKGSLRGGQREEAVTVQVGSGKLIWSPLPVELAEEIAPTVALYDEALRVAGIAPRFTVEPEEAPVLVLPSLFAEALLYTCVAGSDREVQIRITDRELGKSFDVTVPALRTALLMIDRRSGTILSTLKGTPE